MQHPAIHIYDENARLQVGAAKLLTWRQFHANAEFFLAIQYYQVLGNYE